MRYRRGVGVLVSCVGLAATKNVCKELTRLLEQEVAPKVSSDDVPT